MNQQPRVGAARANLVEDLVERQRAVPELLAEIEPQRQEGRRPCSGNDDLRVQQLVARQRARPHDDRSVAGAHRRAVRQDRVEVLHERIRRERHRCRLETPLERPLAERLDVIEDMLEFEAARVDRTRGERPEHEGVVGVRTMAEADQHVHLTVPTLAA